MTEFSSARSSITGSAVPMASFSYGQGEEDGESKEEKMDEEKTELDQGGGNTVTFGGVETFATNSTVASTPGGSEDPSKLSDYALDPFPNYKFLDWSKLKEFADNNFRFDENS